MSNIPNRPGSGRPDDLRSPRTELVPHTPPQGFGSYRGHRQRYEEIFEERQGGFGGTGLGGGGTYGDYCPPLGDDPFDAAPYRDMVLLVHANKKGIRVFVQASRTAFFLILVVTLVVLVKPGIVDFIVGLARSVVGMH